MEERVSPPPSKRQRLNGIIPTDEALNKPTNEVTIYSWNVDGIAPFIQPTITSFFKPKVGEHSGQNTAKGLIRDFLRRHSWPTVLFLQEVKINPDDSATIHAVEQAVKKQPTDSADAHDYGAHFCLPSDKHNARGFGRKVYGVCSIVRKDFAERFVHKIRPVDWDVEGRFLVIETRVVKDVPKLAIFNIYAVNGTDLPYKDPKTGDVAGTRHERKLKVHSLLQAEVRALEADGFGVIIAGDLNIARSHLDGFPNLRTFPKQHCLNRADFEAKFFSHKLPDKPTVNRMDSKGDVEIDESGLGMIDTFRHLHPTQRSYTFYPRSRSFGESCDRVDLIMISRTLANSLVDAGMHATPSERGPSDHVPLYARLVFKETKEDDAD